MTEGSAPVVDGGDVFGDRRRWRRGQADAAEKGESGGGLGGTLGRRDKARR